MTIARIAAPLILLCLCTANAVRAEEGDVDHFKSRLQSALHGDLGMAWLIAPDIAIATTKHSAIHLFSKDGEGGRTGVPQANLFGVLSRDELKKLRKERRIACETSGGTPTSYYRYRVARPAKSMFEFPARAFYTATAPEGNMKAGFTYGTLKREAADAARKALAGGRSARHKHFRVSPAGSAYGFSLHAFYDPKTGLLFRKGLALVDARDRILAAKAVDVSPETTCDGCAIPLFRNAYPANPALDMLEVDHVLNAFVLHGFARPVLMLDTSTVEGRAISLVTFDSSGRYDEYRLYDYVAECSP